MASCWAPRFEKQNIFNASNNKKTTSPLQTEKIVDRQPILVLGGHRLIINSNEHFGGMGFYNALKAPKHKIVNHGPC